MFVLVFYGKADERKKTYEKKMSKGNLEELIIDNKYGQIEIEQHDQEELDIVAEMKVIAKTAAKADEMLELVQVIETPIGENLQLETQFGKEMGITQLLTGINVSIDYKVKIPKGIKLRLIVSNGHVYVGNFEGEINVDIQNGDFKAIALKNGEINIKQDKGKFSVSEVATLNGEFKNCTIEIETGDKVNLTTHSSEGRLTSIEELNIRSSGGAMKIGDIEDLIGSSSFTKYEIQDLANLLDMDLKMGEMNVRNVQTLFSEIRLKGSFTKVGLTFPSGAGYKLELKRNKSVKMDLLPSMKLEERSEKNTIIGTKFVGDPKYTGMVSLELSNGSLFIR